VHEVLQNLNTMLNNVVAGATIDVRNKPDTTGVMLILRAIESLWARDATLVGGILFLAYHFN
jgi:hypothetical protein